MPEDTATHVVLKHKKLDVEHFAAVIPEGQTAEQVVEAWKEFDWVRGSQKELDGLLNEAPGITDTPAVEPATTTKEK